MRRWPAPIVVTNPIVVFVGMLALSCRFVAPAPAAVGDPGQVDQGALDGRGNDAAGPGDATPTDGGKPACEVPVAPGPPQGGQRLLAAQVSASVTHTCAVDTAGQLYCWGQNCGGQLGSGNTIASSLPVKVKLPGDVVAVAAGKGFTCAAMSPEAPGLGGLYCWGENDRGQLGLGDTDRRLTPALVPSVKNVIALAAAREAVCAIDASDALRCWGENREGRLGLGVVPEQDHLTPQPVTGAWRAVSLAEGHGCGIRTGGSLWCWGRNSDGELGLGAGAPLQTRAPQQVGTSADWRQVSTGQHGGCGRREGEILWCWGKNANRQLGLEESGPYLEPERREQYWEAVAAGDLHGCGLRGTTLWCWGRAAEGQLGEKLAEETMPPREVPTGLHFRAVTVGRFQTFAVQVDYTLMATGSNKSGELGLGTVSRANNLKLVLIPPG